jgi:hypothetical protein
MKSTRRKEVQRHEAANIQNNVLGVFPAGDGSELSRCGDGKAEEMGEVTRRARMFEIRFRYESSDLREGGRTYRVKCFPRGEPRALANEHALRSGVF